MPIVLVMLSGVQSLEKLGWRLTVGVASSWDY
jgi:hypothetical protein